MTIYTEYYIYLIKLYTNVQFFTIILLILFIKNDFEKHRAKHKDVLVGKIICSSKCVEIKAFNNK